MALNVRKGNTYDNYTMNGRGQREARFLPFTPTGKTLTPKDRGESRTHNITPR